MDKLKQLEKTPPEEFVVERNHDADLEFRGWLLCGERAADWSGERWTEIDLFRTVGGKLIVAVRQGSTTRGTMRQAGGVCEDGDEVVEWLREDGKGRFGPASKALVRKASQLYPSLVRLPSERVE